MTEQGGRGLWVVAGLAVAAFVVGKYLLGPGGLTGILATAATPQAPTTPGVVLRGSNYASFIPLPTGLLNLFSGGQNSSAGMNSQPAVRAVTDAGAVLTQPGGGMQIVPTDTSMSNPLLATDVVV